MPVGCPHRHRETGAPCIKQYEHGGEHRFKREVKPNPDRPARTDLVLICTVCKRTISYRGYKDPEYGEGHPLHRCSTREVMPFDEVSYA